MISHKLFIKSAGFNQGDVVESIIKFDNKIIYLSRGTNIVTINKNLEISEYNFDTYRINFHNQITNLIKKILPGTDICCLIYIIHDEGSNSTSVSNLNDSLNYLQINKLRNLKYRGSYYFIYDPIKKKLIDEKISNIYPVEKTYNLTENNNLTNISQIKNYYICCKKSIFGYFEDYIKTLNTHLEFKYILLADLSQFEYSSDNYSIYIFCQSIPKNILENYNNIWLLNTEQLTSKLYQPEWQAAVNQNKKVIDYSIENINYIKNNNFYYLPYLYDDLEINKLKSYIQNSNKTYDIIVVGHIPERRQKILTQLMLKNISVCLLEDWGDRRDRQIAKSKLLLNIHAYDDRVMYESHRCDRWLFSGLLILSENSVQSELLDIKNLIIFEKYENLVEKAIQILNNYDEYYNNYIKNYNAEIIKIKSDRQKYLSDFLLQI